MKKLMIILGIVTTIFIINDMTSKEVIIPKAAIRFRVIANSDSKQDQQVKKKVSASLQKNISTTLKNTTDINDTRTLLIKNIPEFEEDINKTLQENNSNQTFTIDYGQNYFPKKNYKNVIYQEGDYESLVVTLGGGTGQNFWCVLFPPLCLLEAEENTNKEDTEYRFLVKDLINKYF